MTPGDARRLDDWTLEERLRDAIRNGQTGALRRRREDPKPPKQRAEGQ